MKTMLSVLMTTIFLALGSCTSEASMSMTPEGIMTQAKEHFASIVAKLETVKDEASATKVSAEVEPMINKVKSLGDTLKGLSNIPGLDAIKAKVGGFTDISTKLTELANGAAGNFVKPLIEKAKAALASFTG